MTITATRPTTVSDRFHARLTGWSLLVLTVVSMPCALLVAESPGRPAQILIGLGILVVAVLDAVVGWGLGRLTSRAGPVALMAALARIGYAVVLGAAATGLMLSPSFGVATFTTWWQGGLFLFGLHLVLTARAMAGARVGRPWLWAIVALGGVAYVLDSPPLHGVVPSAWLMPFMFGELLLLGWLLWLGHRCADQ